MKIRTPYIVLLSAIACSSDGSQRKLGDAAEPPYASVTAEALRGRVIFDDPMLASPTAVVALGRYLVVANNGGDSAVIVIDRATGQFVRAFGRRGDGPGEYRHVTFMDRSPSPIDSSRLWLFDLGPRRLTMVNIDSPTVRPEAPPRMVTLATGSTILAPVWIGDSKLLALGFVQRGRFERFSSRGESEGFAGEPLPNPTGAPQPVLQHAYQSYLSVRPDREKLAVVARHASMVEIYATSGSLLVRTDGPLRFSPTFSVAKGLRGPAMESGGDLRFGYVGVASNAGYIFALFSGHTRSARPGSANFGEYVHVFDWTGKFITAFKLEEPGIAMAADPTRPRLYVVSHEPRPAVIAYDLPARFER